MMKTQKTLIATIVMLALASHLLLGEDPAVDGGPLVPLDSILDVVLFSNWSKEFVDDKAALVDEADGISLFLRISGQKWQRFPDIAVAGGMGQWPTLSLNEAGSLVIDSVHDAIGRAAWRKRLVVAYRQNEIIVAGYEYSSYDKLAREPEVHFEVNYLTGKMILNKGVTNGPPAFIPLSEWEEPEEYR